MQQEINHPEWITYQEAQRLTSLGRTTLWKICCAEGSGVEVAHVGRAVRINRATLMAYMNRAAEIGTRESNGARITEQSALPRSGA